jgi:hypothetical protein
MSSKLKTEVTVGNTLFTVEYLYTPGTPGRHTLPNGDPGYPAEAPEVELLGVTCCEDLLEHLSEDCLDGIEDALLEHEADEESDHDES